MDKPQAVINAAIEQLGAPYVFGMWGDKCTPANRKKYAGYNPDHKDKIYNACPVLSGHAASCAGCKWDGALAFDCRGFTHWVLMQVGIKIDGGGATSQYNTKSNWSERGPLAAMPDLLCCVFRDDGSGTKQHTGLHIGGGTVIHCSGTVKEGADTDRWTHYAVPAGLYSQDELDDAPIVEQPPRTLRRGMSGTDVEDLQMELTVLGYECGEIDGVFGSKTDAAVRAYQQAAGLTVDGAVGPKTRAALDEWLVEQPQRYTVTLRGLIRSAAELIRQQYPDAIITQEDAADG